MYNAICRLHREKELTDTGKQGAVTRLKFLSRGWREVLPDEQVRNLAAQSLDQHWLRAADALQLAAALIWCEQRPNKKHFICGDDRLAAGARAVGFSVLELPRA